MRRPGRTDLRHILEVTLSKLLTAQMCGVRERRAKEGSQLLSRATEQPEGWWWHFLRWEAWEEHAGEARGARTGRGQDAG